LISYSITHHEDGGVVDNAGRDSSKMEAKRQIFGGKVDTADKVEGKVTRATSRVGV